MKERGILFSAPMVRAIGNDTKTQTRRIVKPQPSIEGQAPRPRCPYGVVGDRLWVRETWHPCDGGPIFAADYTDGDEGKREAGVARWYPGIHLRHVDARHVLEIVAVRVERLNDITEDDARAEGMTRETVSAMLPDNDSVLAQQGCAIVYGADQKRSGVDPRCWPIARNGRELFALAWTAINGKRAPWALNPWVWALTFKRVRP